MIDFKGAQFPRSIIVHAVFFYLRHTVSYRDLEAIRAERGVVADHATLNRRVVRYAPMIAARAQARKLRICFNMKWKRFSYRIRHFLAACTVLCNGPLPGTHKDDLGTVMGRMRASLTQGRSKNGAEHLPALTVVLLWALPPGQEAQDAELLQLDGIRSVTLMNGGSLELVLPDGRTIVIPASEVSVLADGSFMVSPEAVLMIDQASGLILAPVAPAIVAAVASGAALLVVGGSNPNSNPTVIGGETAGQTTEDSAATLTVSGQLSVTAANSGQAEFVAQAGTAGSNGFGTFMLGTGGGWTYAATNAQSAIQALGAGQTLTDSFTADGTTQIVTMTIMGVSDAIELSAVEAGTGGFVINGVSASDSARFSVSSAGDVNGDGLDDLIIGAPYDDPNGSLSGASFVVFGKTGTGVAFVAEHPDHAAGWAPGGPLAVAYALIWALRDRVLTLSPARSLLLPIAVLAFAAGGALHASPMFFAVTSALLLAAHILLFPSQTPNPEKSHD